MPSRALRSCVTIDDLRLAARRRLPKLVFDFIDGGAQDKRTLADNRRAFMIGRPLLWGFAAGGEAGVGRATDIFPDELDVATALAGPRNLANITQTSSVPELS